MKPWSLHNDYDRPIARRIAEVSGVSREAFGMHKKGVGRHYYRLPKSRALRRLFLQYLKKQYELSPWFVYTYHILNQTGILFQKSVLWIFRPNLKDRRSTIFWPDLDISFLLWIWATHLLAQRMGHILHGDVEALHEQQKI